MAPTVLSSVAIYLHNRLLSTQCQTPRLQLCAMPLLTDYMSDAIADLPGLLRSRDRLGGHNSDQQLGLGRICETSFCSLLSHYGLALF